MDWIVAPVETIITFDGSEPRSDGIAAMTGGSYATVGRHVGPRVGHGASPSLRRRAGRPPNGHEWAGAARGRYGAAAHMATRERLGSPGIFGQLRDMRDRGLITNEQCVALATAAVGIRLGGGGEGSHVASWRRGEAAEAGDLVAGTPIATFLNRSGETGETYAIGGNGGQPGAHLDHAAVFQKYLTDAGGKRVGMEVSEQYVGSGGAHERAYYFNSGWGEGNASNYYAINTAHGHLGGVANPLTSRDYHAAAMKAAKRAADEQTPSLGNGFGEGAQPPAPIVHNDHELAAYEHGSQPSKKPKISSKEMGRLLQNVDKYGDPSGNRYAHDEWDVQAPSKWYTLDKAEEPHPPPGKTPVPGIDVEPPEGLGRQGKTGGYDIWGAERLPEPENKTGQRYPDEWKPGGTDI